VSEILDFNLLGRDSIKAMRISLDDLLFSEATSDKTDHRLLAIPRSDCVDRHLQPVAKLTEGQGGRPPPLAGHFEVFGPPVTTLLILLSDL